VKTIKKQYEWAVEPEAVLSVCFCDTAEQFKIEQRALTVYSVHN